MKKLESPAFVVMLVVLTLTVIPSKLADGSVTKPSVPETANCTVMLVLILITTVVFAISRRKGEHF